jgi:hypothetical protein
VIATDLRGYGDSSKPRHYPTEQAPEGHSYSNPGTRVAVGYSVVVLEHYT